MSSKLLSQVYLAYINTIKQKNLQNTLHIYSINQKNNPTDHCLFHKKALKQELDSFQKKTLFGCICCSFIWNINSF